MVCNKKHGPGNFGKVYLALYNFVQFLGWSYILLLVIIHILSNKCYIGVWKFVQFPVQIFQSLALLEVVNCVGVPMLLVAWSIAEITRYLYYALTLYNFCPWLLVWCRYSLFVVLYPTGVTGEILTMLTAFPYIRDRQMLSILLPNRANFSFHFHYVLIAILLSYIPFFPQLFGHLWKQRCRVLSPVKNKEQ
ncbi:3-hydroxyacyl-CoA dehydratase 1 isoform X2 [Tachypleus tridentatus]|uniref:3-hydroxyacyl-CoA dehydratase 1 isoform X2 n=1 Tax=Tachypleus tridentatus TaxID=6853 RepID=UPI003FCF71A3